MQEGYGWAPGSCRMGGQGGLWGMPHSHLPVQARTPGLWRWQVAPEGSRLHEGQEAAQLAQLGRHLGGGSTR